MKAKIYSLLGIFIFLFIGCTKETIVENDAPQIEVFEVVTNFNATNNFSRLVPFNPPLFTSDVVLVYIQWDQFNGNPVWRLVPQTVQLPLGDIQYNFDYTRFDANIFMSSADINLNTLGTEWTNNQRFRIVILPGFFVQQMRLDYSNYNDVISKLNSNFNVKIKNLN